MLVSAAISSKVTLSFSFLFLMACLLWESTLKTSAVMNSSLLSVLFHRTLFFFLNCLRGNSARGRRKSDITYQAGVEPQISKCAEMRKETVCAHRQTLWNSGKGYLLSSAPSMRFHVGCGASIPTRRSYLAAASIVHVVSSSSVLFFFRVCGDIVSSWCSTNVS